MIIGLNPHNLGGTYYCVVEFFISCMFLTSGYWVGTFEYRANASLAATKADSTNQQDFTIKIHTCCVQQKTTPLLLLKILAPINGQLRIKLWSNIIAVNPRTYYCTRNKVLFSSILNMQIHYSKYLLAREYRLRYHVTIYTKPYRTYVGALTTCYRYNRACLALPSGYGDLN